MTEYAEYSFSVLAQHTIRLEHPEDPLGESPDHYPQYLVTVEQFYDMLFEKRDRDNGEEQAALREQYRDG